MKYRMKKNKGQSILEVIVALAIFSLIAAAMVSMVAGSFTSLAYGAELTEANILADQAVEAIKSVKDGAWNELVYDTSNVLILDEQWQLGGEGTVETIGKYTREINFTDVCRDEAGDVADCPSVYVDPHSKRVLVTVSWDRTALITNSVTREVVLTNWASKDWTQTSWTGGQGQTELSDPSMYDSQDGNIETDLYSGELRLISGELLDTGFETSSGSIDYDWDFSLSDDYVFDPGDIEVSLDEARLISSGGGLASGDTTNPGFEPDASGWVYTDWVDVGNRVTGSRIASGGNPNGYVNIVVDKAKSQTFSGYWVQPFTTTIDNPSTVDLSFDWRVLQYSANFVTSFKVYVFVDSVNGAPVLGNQVWESSEITGMTSWASQINLDASSKVGVAGTYYVKVAVRVVTGGGGGAASGQNIVGYDNVSVHWEGSSGGYPTDLPTIYPNDAFTISGLGTWSGFSETATKNGGEIYYQLSDDNGSTWQYWNGSGWSVAGSNDYNIASVVDANISDFNSGNEQIKWRAILESDGSQQISIDNINIGFNQSGSPWTYGTWDIDGGELTPVGLHNLSGGNPDGYNQIEIENGVSDEVGGYWEQSFESFKDNPDPVTLDFEYLVSTFTGVPDLLEIRVYVDPTSGAPVNQVGSSIPISGTGSWVSATQFDLSNVVNATGVYYLKIALWGETGVGGGSGPFVVGFDNVVIDLGDGKHPSSGVLTSSAFNTEASSAIQVIEWTETIPSLNESVSLEVSSAPDSGGSPGVWSSWYGESGVASMFTNASGTLISTDLNNDQWIRYRVTLSGDGNDTPVVGDITINYKDE